ncbi:MAG: ribonuclease E/G [Alphaproteobacteria bacterium]|nr:ribonuclease E/G [Alphaproteobacteria bacterium]MBN2675370.1 ribonuclease E/G [Alphaproteobacteria bacterium]
MSKKIYVDAVHPEETRVVVVESASNRVSDFDVETTTKPQIKGNIYLAKVIRVEPSLQAAFVDYGTGKNGFLPFSEIHPDYYEVNPEQKKKLLELAHANIVDDDDDPSDDDEVAEFDDHSAGEDNKEFVKRAREFRIQDVVKPKQILLIQGVKEERGQKGASMTTYLSLAGRFAVLMPNSRKRNSYGISKKISDKPERARLREILHGLKIPKGMTVVLRTAAFGAIAEDISKDYDYLVGLWNDIRKTTLESVAPVIIHTEDSLLRRVVRDFLSDKDDTLIIQGEQAYDVAKSNFQQMYGRAPKKQLVLYKDVAVPLFVKAGIEKQLEGLHGPYVNLPSGGSLVINQTEAMVTIDVNSSRAIKEKDIEQTALKTNLEAAEEIALQLRLRDLAGIVAIDFIDMEEERNNRKLEMRMREVMKRDRARTQVAKINNFGVLMLSRQRLRSSFMESSYVQCPYCMGAGIVPSIQTAAVIMFRHLQEKLLAKSAQKIIMTIPTDVAVYLLNHKKTEISEMEGKFDTEIVIVGDDSMMNIDQYSIQRIAPEANKTEDILNAHSPSTYAKKKNANHIEAKKTTMNAPHHRRRKKQPPKPKSFWEKIVG